MSCVLGWMRRPASSLLLYSVTTKYGPESEHEGASNGSFGAQPKELNPKQVSPVRSVYPALLPVNRGFQGGHDAFSGAAALYLDKAIVPIANDGFV